MQEEALESSKLNPLTDMRRKLRPMRLLGGTPNKWQRGSALMASPKRFPLHHDSLFLKKLKINKNSTLTSILELLYIRVNSFSPPLTEFINPSPPIPIPFTPTALPTSLINRRGLSPDCFWGAFNLWSQNLNVTCFRPQCLSFLVGEMGLLPRTAESGKRAG